MRARFTLCIVFAVGSGLVGFPHRALAASGTSGYCRTLLNFAINPVSGTIKVIHAASAKIATQFRNQNAPLPEFQTEAYWKTRLALRDSPSLNDASNFGESKIETVEQVLAHLDARIEKWGAPITTIQSLDRASAANRSRFLEEFSNTLSGKSAASDQQLDRLSLLFYSMSRNLPYDFVETLLRTPGAGMRRIVSFETDRLLMKHAFLDVLNQFGIPASDLPNTFRRNMARNIRRSFQVLAKAAGMREAPLELTALANNPAFFREVLLSGYEKAVLLHADEIHKVLGRRAITEVALAASGVVFAAYATYDLAAWLVTKKEKEVASPDHLGRLPTNVSDQTRTLSREVMKQRLLDHWLAKQELDYGKDNVPQADRESILVVFDNLEDEEMRQRYDAVFDGPAAE